MNEFADISQEEFGEHYLGYNYSKKSKDKKPMQTYKRSKTLKRMDEEFDWTTKGAVTQVRT